MYVEKQNKENTIGCAEESEIQKYFRLRKDIETSIDTMLQLGGKGMFIDEYNPAIYRLRGMLDGMDTASRYFDL